MNTNYTDPEIGTITISAPSFRATTGMLRLLAEDGNAQGKAWAWEEITRWATMLDNLAAAEKRAADDERETFETYGLDRATTLHVLDHLGVKPEGRDDALGVSAIVNAINALAEAKRSMGTDPQPPAQPDPFRDADVSLKAALFHSLRADQAWRLYCGVRVDAETQACAAVFYVPLSWSRETISNYIGQPAETAMEEAKRQTFLNAAREAFGSDEIQIDNDALAAAADNGAWVQSWVWVSNDEAGIEDEPEPAPLCDLCHNDRSTITVERAVVAEGEAPELRLCTNCYADVEFS